MELNLIKILLYVTFATTKISISTVSCMIIIYSVMMQYYSVKHKTLQMSLIYETRKAKVETIRIMKQLKYGTKGHIAIRTILF